MVIVLAPALFSSLCLDSVTIIAWVHLLTASNSFISSIMGWLGTIAYLLAYLLLSINKLHPDKKLYHALNILGALGLIFHAIQMKDYPNLFVNIVWCIIALLAIFLILKKSSPNS